MITKKEKVVSEKRELSPFDFIMSINDGYRGKDLMDGVLTDSSLGSIPDSPDKSYVAFMVNRGLSYFQDTILYANSMNERPALHAKMQYDFLRHAIRPRKRFSKWTKKDNNTNDVTILMNKYGYTTEKARDALKLFSDKALIELRQSANIGGLGKIKK